MTREELIELAALDAVGLLSEYEAALFTRSFHHASAAVQDEILNLQAEIAADTALLPSEDPEDSLRDRVLAAVADAIEKDAEPLSPIATIGRSRRSQRIASAPRTRMSRSGHFWRAAAFAMMTTTIVMGYFWNDARTEVSTIKELLLPWQTGNEITELVGPGWKDFVGNPTCQEIHLQTVDNSRGGPGVVYVNDRTDEVFVFVMGVHRGADYTIEIANEDGIFESIGELVVHGPIAVARLSDVAASVLTSSSFQISINGEAILRRA